MVTKVCPALAMRIHRSRSKAMWMLSSMGATARHGVSRKKHEGCMKNSPRIHWYMVSSEMTDDGT